MGIRGLGATASILSALIVSPMATAAALVCLALLLLPVAGCTPETSPATEGRAESVLPEPWPPRVGERYPDLELLDVDGRPVRLSLFAGRVILLEPIGMNCPACNSFAGANRPGQGGINGLAPQKNLPSIYEGVERYAPGVDLADLVLVHLLLYDYGMEAPDQEDARHWDEHFGVSRHGGLVLYPAHDLRSKATYGLIPGFQLIDQKLVLRYDSTGHRPRHNLWTELLPALPAVLDGR